MKIKERTPEVENAELVRQERGSKGAIQPLKSREPQTKGQDGIDQVNLEVSKAILEIAIDNPKKDLDAIKRKYANGQFPNDLAEKLAGGAIDNEVSVLQALVKDPSEVP